MVKKLYSFILVLAAASFSLSLHAGVPRDAQTLVEFDATWRFHDLDEDLGTSWIQADFDHSEWATGEALLGYDTRGRSDRWPDPGFQTQMTENLITYYLRKEFEFSGTGETRTLYIEQIIDDGAVYYLNGEEIARSELMPSGTIDHSTSTTHFTNPWGSHDILEVEDPPLREGRNVLAVSLHNHARGSSDIAFGARVSVTDRRATPMALYLTWQRDPTTTMTIHWHTDEDHGMPAVEFQPVDGGDPVVLQAETRHVPHFDRLVHTVEATGLDPDTTYSFRISNVEPGIHSPQYRFRTMPATVEQPIRIAIGGDVRHRQEWMEQVNRQAMRFDPHFIVWGGDLAYADGHPNRHSRWRQFFDAMMNTLITDEGRVVPVIFGIGNHEIRGGYYFRDRDIEDMPAVGTDEFRELIAPYYYRLFAFPGHPGYGVLDFGNYLSIILLDTDHSGPIEGKQTEWLEQTLAARTNVTHVIPVYHVPGYPSVRNFGGGVSRRVRESFIPLFERYGVEVAFENHDHAYKRTIPILGNEPDPSGIVYIGDGAWGVGERLVHDADETWYLERSQSIRHVIMLTLFGASRDMKMISREGDLIDHFIDFATQRSRNR